MKALLYRERNMKDHVHINMMRATPQQVTNLEKVIGKIPSPLPDGLLSVRFFIYKKQPSMIEVNGKRIDFIYNIHTTYGVDIPGSSPTSHTLSFTFTNSVTDPKEGYLIKMPFDCTTKKTLIKYLLNSLSHEPIQGICA